MRAPILRFKDNDGLDFPALSKGVLDEFLDSIQSGKSKNKADDGLYNFYGSTGLIGRSNTPEYSGKSILIARVGANAGYIYEVDGSYCVSDNTLILRLKTPNNESFFFNLLTKLNLNKLVFGSGQPLITAGILKTLPVMVPCDKEQTKVANFLNIIDKKIHLLTQKHDLLTQYKKGLVQQIFSQKLRLKNKDSLHFTDWKDFSLKNVLAKNSIKNKNVEFNLVQSISNKYGFINQDELFEDRVIASKNLSNYYVIKKGAFAYNPSRIDVGSLAYKSDDLTSVVSPLYVSFYTKADLIVDSFLLIWFDSGQFKKQMNSSFEGSVRNTLSYDSLSNMIITLPSIEEQLKISEFFKVMDSKITTTQSQLELLKQYKQGLLQQMFI